MRSRYWTIGPFADWLRGTKSPLAETREGWRDWEKQARTAHPVRYWLAEEGLQRLQNFVMWPIDKIYAIKYYINNRWITATHCLTASPSDIPRGEWRDVGNRFLPCLFNELRDFVEVELAWWHIAWADNEEKKKYNAPFWATGWFRWRTWRCPKAGLDNLAWQKTCDNKDYTPEDDPHYGALTQQAYNAMEIEALYRWWTEVRPKRVDPMEASGWSAYCDAKWRSGKGVMDDLVDDSGETIDTSKMLEQMHQMEQAYEQEDEEMIIRLIKIRQSLWT
jgi:hypothetical protein